MQIGSLKTQATVQEAADAVNIATVKQQVMSEGIASMLLERHRETVEATIVVGRQVAEAWEEPHVSDSRQITDPLWQCITASRLDEQLIRLLVDTVQALGGELGGQPVAAPPYLVIGSQGPICRATMADGRRVVVELRLFAVERNPSQYVFLDTSPEDCLRIDIKQ